jgi:uncharacterized protein
MTKTDQASPPSPLAPFWDAARAGRLAIHYCRACGQTRFPPAPICSRCLSPDQAWRDASGRGTLESWAEMHRPYWDRYKDKVPYSVCLIRLEEGPLLVSNLVGEVQTLSIGMPVEVVFEKQADGNILPKFAIAAGVTK